MYETFVSVQEDLYDMKQQGEDDLQIEMRLVALHYLLNRLNPKEKKDLDGFMKSYYDNYLILAEQMKKNYIQKEDKNEIFQMSRQSDAIN